MGILLAATDKKPGKPFAEDLFGHCGNLYWLLDGATPPIGKEYALLTRDYVKLLDLSLKSRADDNNKSLKAILGECIADVASQQGARDEWFQPSSTISIVRLSEETIEYLVLGDNTLMIELEDRVHIITDDRIHLVATNERQLVRSLAKERLGESEGESYHAARLRLIQAELAARNKPGGYWICSYEPIASDYALSGALTIHPNSHLRILMTTDGLTRLITHFQEYKNMQELADALESKGGRSVFGSLRALERNHDCFSRPASSVHDDASFVLLGSKSKPCRNGETYSADGSG